jgi:lambda family phage minor tail protein L
MPIIEDVQGLDLEDGIDLFQINGRNQTIFFCNIAGVSFNGQEYEPVPISFNWTGLTADGAVPGSKLTVSDESGYLGGLIQSMGGFIGTILSVKRTWKAYLDNQITSDPTQFQGDLKLIINQRTWEPQVQIEFDCIGGMDFQRLTVPARGYFRRCQWILRTSTYDDGNCQARLDINYNLAGQVTSNGIRECRHDLDMCKLYHGHVRRYGGFPGVRRYD